MTLEEVRCMKQALYAGVDMAPCGRLSFSFITQVRAAHRQLLHRLSIPNTARKWVAGALEVGAFLQSEKDLLAEFLAQETL